MRTDRAIIIATIFITTTTGFKSFITQLKNLIFNKKDSDTFDKKLQRDNIIKYDFNLP